MFVDRCSFSFSFSFSQLVTLYLTPVFYTYMARRQTRLANRKSAPALQPITTGK